MRVPLATYRVQLNRDYGFRRASELPAYLDALGISDLYTSPIFKARSGSRHGYDIVDPKVFNPELGSDDEFEGLSKALQDRHMGLLLDIVPNHMAASSENPYWLDVLRAGQLSDSARIFDINWGRSDGPPGKVLLPILGESYGQALEKGEIALGISESGFLARYHEHHLPLSPVSWPLMIEHCLREARVGREVSHETMVALQHMARHPGGEAALGATAKASHAAATLWALYQHSDEAKSIIEAGLASASGVPGEPASFDLLHAVLERQHYRLTHWRLSAEMSSYRRFFDVNDLVGVRVEDATVFALTHELLLRLVKQGQVTGVRVDHVDGLADPDGYLSALERDLRRAAGARRDGVYTVVEKIVLGQEKLPAWAAQGTTGYDFLTMVNGLFIDRQGYLAMEDALNKMNGASTSFDSLSIDKKRDALFRLFTGEFDALVDEIVAIARHDRYARDIPAQSLAEGLAEITVSLPVYRTYVDGRPMSEPDRASLSDALDRVAAARPDLGGEAHSFLARFFLGQAGEETSGAEARQAFFTHWQQLTGPLMAKGVEDTAIFAFPALISMNEVGRSRSVPGVEDFHEFCVERQQRWPHSLNATSTHDTKWSEDVRARASVIAENAGAWEWRFSIWSRKNRSKKTEVQGVLAPDLTEEALIYQTLLAAWPLTDGEVRRFRYRMKNFTLKAMREAKTHTSWTQVNADWERAVLRFVDALFDDTAPGGFAASFIPIQRRTAYYGAINSLAQVLIKITAPGVPDFYQGQELLNYNLVDPDNRRPIDFAKRRALLEEMASRRDGRATCEESAKQWRDGRAKMYLTMKALGFRREYASLFQEGDYLPLEVSGSPAHAIAYARVFNGVWGLVVAPRLISRIGRRDSSLRVPDLTSEAVALPKGAPRTFGNVLTGESFDVADRRLPLAEAFRDFPVALLHGEAAG